MVDWLMLLARGDDKVGGPIGEDMVGGKLTAVEEILLQK